MPPCPATTFQQQCMLVVNMRAAPWLCLFVASDEEIIFRSWDGDIMKFNTSSNETELLMKNTTFVSIRCFFFLFKLQSR